MQLSDRFLELAQQQLQSLAVETAMARLALYVTDREQSSTPTLTLVAQWPLDSALPPAITEDPSLRSVAQERRWYPLRHENMLLGVLRAEQQPLPGRPVDHDPRLQICAETLACILGLEQDRRKLHHQLDEQRQQLNLVVHQLRNPLTALRTYAQLLLRRIGPDDQQRSLVESLIQEQDQLNRYLQSLDRIGQGELRLEADASTPLLLPPVPVDAPDLTVADLLNPLIQRASATATLQNRPWHGPDQWTAWTQAARPAADAVMAEIVANLLENAFRYSPPGCALGLKLLNHAICVWDAGPSIPATEHERIFQQGVRGSSSTDRPGSGLGLSLARRLAENRGGSLNLHTEPKTLDADLPAQGNAFLLKLPATEQEQATQNPAA
ncbi:MAG: Signal transduction histidine-protein kinase/phosphatase MprB [Synechococcus sp. MIT S9220]|nr:MAG: Signal transduction histidine-protein kinase/phosphatase MprB [Synechococcus sp. MIT S9220]